MFFFYSLFYYLPNSCKRSNNLIQGNVGLNGKYEITQYQFDDNVTPNIETDDRGTLTVKGKQANTVSNLEVQFNIETTLLPEIFAPVYLHNQINLGGNNIIGENANVVCNKCPPPPPSECENGELSQTGLENSFGANKQAQLEGTLYLAKMMNDEEFKESVTQFLGTTEFGAYDLGKINGSAE